MRFSLKIVAFLLAAGLLAGSVPLYALCAPEEESAPTAHHCPMCHETQAQADQYDRIELLPADSDSPAPCCTLKKSPGAPQSAFGLAPSVSISGVQVDEVAGVVPSVLAARSPIASAAPVLDLGGPPQAVLCTFLI